MAHIEYSADKDLGSISVIRESKDGAESIVQEIQFQHGAVQENGINGVQNEEVLKLLGMRLRALNAKFPCRENSLAITKIEEALLWLEHRTAIRVEQGVEGLDEAHVS